MKVLVLHTIPPGAAEEGRDVGEFDLSAAAHNVAAPLDGAVVRAVRGEPREILELLDQTKPAVVFNLCEAPLGRPDLEPQAAALFEWVGMRFTGCGSETLALCRRKDFTSAVLQASGVPVPGAMDSRNPEFPCMVKPAAEDGSAGIHHYSVCGNFDDLENALAHLPLPAIIQKFVPGREFAVSLWGRFSPDYASIGETVFEQGLRLITYAAKWEIESDDFRNSPMTYSSQIEPALREAILDAARGAWRAVDARHALRVDIRLDAAGLPLVLDVNPNPEISPGVGICRAVQEAGWRWEDFVRKLVQWT